uniref:Ionotropic glutamate receptor C-terminal domain-containing protein n=4 Tax=Clastoptera arizonana TaxID=38151 RepID=A0A1B6DAB3_9HEMI
MEKDIFIRNTTDMVWLYMCCVLGVLAVCFRISTNQHHRIKPSHSDWPWIEVIQWVLAAICQQGAFKEPLGCSCRTMFLIGYFVTYLLYTGFAAGVTSLLAIRKDAVMLSLNDVIEQKFQLATVDNFNENTEISSLVDDRKIIKCINFKSLLYKVLNSNTIGMAIENDFIQYLTTKEDKNQRCKLVFSVIPYSTQIKAFAVHRSSPYKEKLNYWLLRLCEHGVLKRSSKKFFKKVPECPLKPGFTEASYRHVQSAFLILQFSIFISAVLLLAEIFIYHNKTTLFRVKRTKNNIGRQNNKPIIFFK